MGQLLNVLVYLRSTREIQVHFVSFSSPWCCNVTRQLRFQEQCLRHQLCKLSKFNASTKCNFLYRSSMCFVGVPFTNNNR